jgi:hypothetical protein
MLGLRDRLACRVKVAVAVAVVAVLAEFITLLTVTLAAA